MTYTREEVSKSFFLFKQKTAYEISLSLVGSEMCIRDRVATEFLQGEEYGPDSPPRYVSYRPHKGAEVEYAILRGPIYGQRGASQIWHDTLAKWLVSVGFEQGRNDPCIFINKTTGMRLWVGDR